MTKEGRLHTHENCLRLGIPSPYAEEFKEEVKEEVKEDKPKRSKK